jgi:hypothetical protein
VEKKNTTSKFWSLIIFTGWMIDRSKGSRENELSSISRRLKN